MEIFAKQIWVVLKKVYTKKQEKALDKKKDKEGENEQIFFSKFILCEKITNCRYKSKTQQIIIILLHLKFLPEIKNFYRLTLLLPETMLK